MHATTEEIATHPALQNGSSKKITSTSTSTQQPSLFTSLPDIPIDEVFALLSTCAADPTPNKINLSAGVYRNDAGRPWPLSTVARVEANLSAIDDVERHEYLGIAGDPRFLACAQDLTFGFTSATPSAQKARVTSVQTISGTGANHIGAAFLTQHTSARTVWISDPSWANHMTIWDIPGVTRKLYPYYNASTRAFDFDGMVDTLSTQAQPGDIVVLHACAHNPTGLDPTQSQWRSIATLCQKHRLFPFFDSAYQGFATGDPDADAWAIRHFFTLPEPIEMCVAQSFSKNFGLYGQRVGAFHLVTNPSAGAVGRAVLVANFSEIIRKEFSMAPRYGSTIVRAVLEDAALAAQWRGDLKVMSERIMSMRGALYGELTRLGTPGEWGHIVGQIGMFSYTGLSGAQVARLRERHHVYMLRSGRASISGITGANVKQLAAAIDEVVRNA